MMIHIDKVKGDFVIAEWNDPEWEEFNDKTEELVDAGYKKIGKEHDYLNYYEYYWHDNGEILTVTMMCL
ncbi:hypothetical protein [Halobacillus litoralis]|uniref:hypothetical protein n=1 Tax=Halobacillus litoralis TaxID=45668 RepID=UPI001CD48F0E|nr:hypothetical protein [Halobacillus litoralis]MCA1021552.1 hypothetical protein [Halobacillus litoralis]